ncbi:unnamed protein product, partial [Laminaria digitata]
MQNAFVQMVSSWIYTASAFHAAVNFPQKSIVSYVPNTPGSVYAVPPADKVSSSLVLDIM